MKPRVLVAEPSAPVANALRKFLSGWAEVQVVSYADEAVQVLRARPPDVIIAAVNELFDGELLAPQFRRQTPLTAIVLSYPEREALTAPERARQAGADSFFVGPPKKHVVLGVVQAVVRLNALATQLRGLEERFAEVKQKAALKVKPSQVGLNAPDEAFFKKYMLLEVRRGRRYRYPLALMLVAFDGLDEAVGEAAPDFERAAIRAEALEVLSSLLRDIDVAMPFGKDRYLLFLPHTAPAGASVVAGRVVEKLAALETFRGGTVSVGVAGYEPRGSAREQVSFGGLVREAGVALKRAQESGGNRYQSPEPAKVKRSRISMA